MTRPRTLRPGRKTLAALLAFGITASLPAAAGGMLIVPHLDVRSADGTVSIVGRATADGATTFMASLSLRRDGPSGSMRTLQGGSQTLAAGKTATIARLSTSLRPGDHLAVELTILLDGVTVASTRMDLAP